MKDTQVVLQNLRERREWKQPYAAIEPPGRVRGQTLMQVMHADEVRHCATSSSRTGALPIALLTAT